MRWRGGSPVPAATSGRVPAHDVDRRARRSPAVLAVMSGAGLAAWASVAWLPVMGLFRLLRGGAGGSRPVEGALASGILTAIPELRDPVLFQVVTDSAMFGLLIATGLLLAAWAAGLSSPGASRGAPRRWLSPITELPPLILGTGVLALPWLIGLVTRFLLDHGQDRAAAVVGKIAAAAEPHKHPWILMGIAVGLVLLPWLFRNQSRHVAVAPSPGGLDPGFEAGVHAGLSRWRARALARPGRLVAAAGRFAVVWVIAATNLSPALILSTGSAGKRWGRRFWIFAAATRWHVRRPLRLLFSPCSRISLRSRSPGRSVPPQAARNFEPARRLPGPAREDAWRRLVPLTEAAIQSENVPPLQPTRLASGGKRSHRWISRSLRSRTASFLPAGHLVHVAKVTERSSSIPA